jgi:hypothetical protein
MGYRHTSHHDKTSIRPDRALDFLLSLCFCDTCSGALGEQGVDGTEVAVRVAGLLRERLDGGDCMAPPASEDAPARLVEDLGEPVLRAVLRHRERTCTALLARLRGVVPTGVRLSAHLSLDPLSSGSPVALPVDLAHGHLDGIVVTHYGETVAGITRAWQAAGVQAPGTQIAIWPKSPEFTTDDDLRAIGTLVAECGLEGLRVYHLGLLPWRTTERVLGVLGGDAP